MGMSLKPLKTDLYRKLKKLKMTSRMKYPLKNKV